MGRSTGISRRPGITSTTMKFNTPNNVGTTETIDGRRTIQSACVYHTLDVIEGTIEGHNVLRCHAIITFDPGDTAATYLLSTPDKDVMFYELQQWRKAPWHDVRQRYRQACREGGLRMRQIKEDLRIVVSDAIGQLIDIINTEQRT